MNMIFIQSPTLPEQDVKVLKCELPIFYDVQRSLDCFSWFAQTVGVHS